MNIDEMEIKIHAFLTLSLEDVSYEFPV